MSVQQEAGKVATSAIDALKTSPILLAFVIIVSALIGGVMALTYFSLQAREERMHVESLAQRQNDAAERMEMIKRCFPMAATYSNDGGSTVRR
jgi:Flp pilus assembly protein protease CpaA